MAYVVVIDQKCRGSGRVSDCPDGPSPFGTEFSQFLPNLSMLPGQESQELRGARWALRNEKKKTPISGITCLTVVLHPKAQVAGVCVMFRKNRIRDKSPHGWSCLVRRPVARTIHRSLSCLLVNERNRNSQEPRVYNRHAIHNPSPTITKRNKNHLDLN